MPRFIPDNQQQNRNIHNRKGSFEMNPTPHVHSKIILRWAEIVASGEEKSGWWKLLCRRETPVDEPWPWVRVHSTTLQSDECGYKINMTKHHPNFTISQEKERS
jgi:hypothetical protein